MQHMHQRLIETTRAAWALGVPTGSGDLRAAAPAPAARGIQPMQMRRHNPASGLPLLGDGSRDVKGNSFGTLDAQLEC